MELTWFLAPMNGRGNQWIIPSEGWLHLRRRSEAAAPRSKPPSRASFQTTSDRDDRDYFPRFVKPKSISLRLRWHKMCHTFWMCEQKWMHCRHINVPELFPKTIRWFCCGAEQCWFVAVGIWIDSIQLRAESPNLGVLYSQAKSSCLQTRQDWIIYLTRRWTFRQQTHTCNLSTWQHRDLQSEYGCLIWQVAFSRNLILENPQEK
jgi:hypothetical protein